MALHTFTELTYAVIHSEDGYLQYDEMSPGTELVTPHTVETFTDEDEAKVRAEELGYVFGPPPGLPDELLAEEMEEDGSDAGSFEIELLPSP
jgi:hypothetical protein